MDCLRWTGFFASSTTNTLCTVRVIHRVHFHLACFCTFSTVNAFLLIYTIAKYRYFIKYRIKSSQRADIFAKWSIYHNSKKNRDYQNHIFPEVKPSHCTSHGFIQQNQRKTALQRSCRTDQFAEIRAPCPMISTTNIGRRITNTIKMTYFNLRSSLSPRNVRIFFGNGILFNKS